VYNSVADITVVICILTYFHGTETMTGTVPIFFGIGAANQVHGKKKSVGYSDHLKSLQAECPK
jgi:hypothetical protein